MKIRTTEKPHSFTEKLRTAIPIYDLQGLTLNSDYDFTAGIEAVEFEADETIDIKRMFRKDEWIAKLCLCNELSVPLYIVTHKSGKDLISVYEASLYSERDGFDFQIIRHKTSETKNFADWWRELKGTKQSKPLYEASSRISYFDRLLEDQGLAWGGNVDGFMLSSEMKPLVIIETRYTEKNPLEVYDPATFYPPHYTRAGDFKTWEPVVLLASRLETPLFLFTLERRSDEERIGLAIVDSISEKELKYQDVRPNKNIIRGMENIRRQIIMNLSRKPPTKF